MRGGPGIALSWYIGTGYSLEHNPLELVGDHCFRVDATEGARSGGLGTALALCGTGNWSQLGSCITCKILSSGEADGGVPLVLQA